MSADTSRSRRGRESGINLPQIYAASAKYSRQASINARVSREKKSFRNFKVVKYLTGWMPGSPEHMAFKKKIAITKRSSTFGLIWDISQVVFSILACALYV